MKRIIYCFLLIFPLFLFGQKSFSTGTFKNASDYQLFNYAKIIDGDVRLTTSDDWQTGAIWYKDKVTVEHGFEVEFQMIINHHAGWQGKGADGLAFVISNDGRGKKVGEAGEGIGYGGISNCIVFEFDTFDNEEGSDNHVSIQTNGKGEVTRFNNHSIAINHKIPRLRDKVRKVKITYDYKYMRVYIDTKLYLKKAVSLEQLIKLDNGKAWIGFTAATAGAHSQHKILSWKWQKKKHIFVVRPKPEETTIAVLNIDFNAILRRRRLSII